MGFFYWGEDNNPARRASTNNDPHTRYARPPKVRDYFPISRPPRVVFRLDSDWSPRGWRRARIERVRLDQLHATPTWISRAGLRHHARPGARPDGGELPCVVCYQGRYWLFDGHHRAITAIDRGERYLTARVKRPEEVAA